MTTVAGYGAKRPERKVGRSCTFEITVCDLKRATLGRFGPKGGPMSPAPPLAAIPVEDAILAIRGQKVLLDADLAPMYGVTVKALNQAVKRNLARFPPDFMFELTADEASNLRSQFVTSSSWGGRRYLPRAFTEQGVAMLSSVLRGERAALVNVEIMRAFVRLRQILQQNTALARKLATLEKKYDAQFRVVFDAIRELMAPPVKQRERIGFKADDG
jgi:ORF6N domain